MAMEKPLTSRHGLLVGDLPKWLPASKPNGDSAEYPTDVESPIQYTTYSVDYQL